MASQDFAIERLRRTNWDADNLAQEVYAILATWRDHGIQGPLKINGDGTQPAIQITTPSESGFPITVNVAGRILDIPAFDPGTFTPVVPPLPGPLGPAPVLYGSPTRPPSPPPPAGPPPPFGPPPPPTLSGGGGSAFQGVVVAKVSGGTYRVQYRDSTGGTFEVSASNAAINGDADASGMQCTVFVLPTGNEFLVPLWQ